MKSKKIASLALAAFLSVSSVPFTAGAAPQVYDVYGVNSVFCAAFGKVTYDGKKYDAYRSFEQAFSELCAVGGGDLYFTGTLDLSDFDDPAGRPEIELIGAIDEDNQNVIDFGSRKEFVLGGNLTISRAATDADNTVSIKTNGHSFSIVRDTDTFYAERYNPLGDNYYEYSPAPSVSTGTISEINGSFSAYSGKLDTVTSGALFGETVGVSVKASVGGDAVITKFITGNAGNGTLAGNSSVAVTGGNISELYAGTLGGKVAGDIDVEISGGSIGKLIVGAAPGTTVSGNVTVNISGSAKIGAFEKLGDISGKSVLVLSDGASVTAPDGIFDHVITISGGNAVPVSSAGTFSGFRLEDEIGVALDTAVINGSTAAADANGLFAIPEGSSSVSVVPTALPAVNTAAKYIAGYSDGSFRPAGNMTRAEAITLLSRLIIDENLIKGKIDSGYGDVADGSWYEPYIGLFENLGYLSGLDSTGGIKIYPDKHITRGEFVSLIYEIAMDSDNTRSEKLVTIPDVSRHTPNAEAIFYAASSGIVTGYEDGSFRPAGSITRAEVVAIVNRFIGRVPTGAANEAAFGDIGEHWAHSQIAAACGTEGISWTKKSEDETKYIMPGTDTKQNIIALYEQSSSLSGDAIRDGVDVIAEQMKQNIINSPDTLEDAVTGTKYYLSSENGNNKNDGLSPETAWRNYTALKKVELKPGDGVFFERGGVYRGQLTVSEGVTYAAYGTGNKPVLMQSSRNYADERFWSETDVPNVWSLMFMVDNVGIMAFDHDITQYGNYDAKYGRMMNYNTFGFMDYADLKNDLEFYSNLSTKTLYLYSAEGNPGARFKSIEIGEKVNIINGSAKNVHIDNLSVMFTGAHGMGSGTTENRRVTNCIFSWLGGSVHSTNSSTGAAINYGNAVEIYGGCNGYYVENNWMYQIYDTGVTHQYSRSGEGDCFQQNIHYYGNLIEHVFWGIEAYNGYVGGTKRYTKDVHISHNVLRNGGDSWGSYARFREKQAPLYSITHLSDNSGELTEYNIFDRCLGNLISVDDSVRETDDKNIYIQTVGNALGNLKGVYRDFGYGALEDIAEFFGDKNAVAVAVK